MLPPTRAGGPSTYLSRLLVLSGRSVVQLVRPSSHSRRAKAARRLARHSLLFASTGAGLVILLMITFDASEIVRMPPRGTPSLWPARILTDFGKDAYVLWTLAGAMVAVGLVGAGLRGTSRALLVGVGTRVQFMFLAVLVPVLVGNLLKLTLGRGRPFVGGNANPFNFMPFTGFDAYYSLPSSHAVTAFALAFAVGALWPRARIAMFVYAIIIALTRLLLLAHHPSDVVAGALLGIIGAMAVRYWFAARRLAFAIRRDGEIVARPGPGFDRLKRVAHGAPAP